MTAQGAKSVFSTLHGVYGKKKNVVFFLEVFYAKEI